jgi:hypothetical protein
MVSFNFFHLKESQHFPNHLSSDKLVFAPANWMLFRTKQLVFSILCHWNTGLGLGNKKQQDLWQLLKSANI